MLQVEMISGGMMPTNCYLLTDSATGISAVVDPGFWDQRLEVALEGKKVSCILLTHCHFDHILGTAQVQKKTGAPVYLHQAEEKFPTSPELNLSGMMGLSVQSFETDRLLQDGDTVMVGESVLEVLHTPGHTAGSCCFRCGETLLTGDTLMAGSMGRTDFPTGSWSQISESLQRLSRLEGDAKVYCGHGPSTSLNRERATNPYMMGDMGI